MSVVAYHAISFFAGGLLFYLVAVFVIPKVIIPLLKKRDYKKSVEVPEFIKKAILEIEGRASHHSDYLERASKHILTYVRGGRGIKKDFPLLLFRNHEDILSSKGELACMQLNYILYIYLTNSRYFSPRDIKIRNTFFSFNFHQYLKVKINGNKQPVKVDLWANCIGVPLGERAPYFYREN
jgi:hypothetical protein